MITLITGGPGTGKTAWVIDQILEIKKHDPHKILYVHGIRDFKLSHIPVYCRSPLCDICRSKDIELTYRFDLNNPNLFLEDWPHWKEPGSLIIVDEVQRIWRPRAGSKAPDEAVSALETHRHYGLDFWLISQGPHLFDNFIRLLVGRHVHLVAKWSGRVQYEWPECKQNVAERSGAVERPYTLPKRVYTLYHSAEVHTKQDKRRPMSFYFMIASFVIGVIGITYAVKRIRSRIEPVPVSASIQSSSSTSVSPVMNQPVNQYPQVVTQYPDFEPTKPGVPESAPAYSGLIQVKAAPLLSGCVLDKKKDVCSCYTQQATPYPASKVYCQEQVAGRRFNPYLQPRIVFEGQQARQQSKQPLSDLANENSGSNDRVVPSAVVHTPVSLSGEG